MVNLERELADAAVEDNKKSRLRLVWVSANVDVNLSDNILILFCCISFVDFFTVTTSAKEVIFSSMFVCLFVVNQRDYGKSAQLIFAKFDRKVVHGPRKKPLDFGDYPDHITLGLG